MNSGVVFLMGEEGTFYRFDVDARKLAGVCHRKGGGFGGLAADPTKPERRYFSFGDGAFFVSDDEGRTWRPLEPAPPFHDVRALAVAAGRLAVAADGAVHSISLEELP